MREYCSRVHVTRIETSVGCRHRMRFIIVVRPDHSIVNPYDHGDIVWVISGRIGCGVRNDADVNRIHRRRSAFAVRECEYRRRG